MARLVLATAVAGGIGLAWSPTPALAYVFEQKAIAIAMRDGQSLAADVYLPSSGGGPWPIIVVQTPYDKAYWSATFEDDQDTDALFKSPSYGWVVIDWRGFYGSTSAQYPGCPTHGQDGYDAVEWVAQQKWSNGKVGAWGYSALGTALVGTAQEAPPHLLAGVPVTYFWKEAYDDLSYPGGVYQKNRDDSSLGDGAATKPHPYYDSWWAYVDATDAPVNQIRIPMLHVTGWYDHETDATLNEMQRMQTGGAPGALGTQKALIGPWTHASVNQAQQGQLSYPDAATMASEAALQFFDYYMRGIANGYDQQPTYRYYQTNEARWVSSPVWPPTEVTTQTNYMRQTLLGTSVPSSTESARFYSANPNDPVPTLFGAVLDDTNTTIGPGDLRPIESRPDVLGFTTTPYAAPLAIAGRPVAHLHFTSTVVDTDIAVRLTQVHPDGTSMLIVDSIHRASLRDQYEEPEFLSNGPVYEMDVKLPSIAITIPPGDALRVLVEPSNYDRFDKNMQDGSAHSDDPGAVATIGTTHILLDSTYPSWIDLPVVSSGLGVPSKLTATAPRVHTVDLAWRAAGGEPGVSAATGFTVERSTDGRSFTEVATLPASNTRWSSTGLERGRTYYFRVAATSGAAKSGYSNVASVRTPLL